jgi:hypothetical protein
LRYHGNFPMALDEQGQRVLVGFRSPPRLSHSMATARLLPRSRSAVNG